MKLFLDEHYPNQIATALRAAGHDAVTVSERGLNGTSDEELLTIAATEARALVTNNARDFLPLHSAWLTSGRHHFGLLLTADASMPRTKKNIGAYVVVLSELLDENTADRALENQVRWLP